MFEMRPYRRNSMSTWNPFSEMEEMERRLFNNDFFSGRGLAEFKTDITDEGDYYELKADLPGFKKEDIQLQLDVLLLEAGQVGLQLVVVAFIGDVGFELRQTAAGEEVVVEKATLHLLHLGEGIPGAHRISAVRSHFKHNQFLLSNPDDP